VGSRVTVRYWAGARRAAGLHSEEIAADDLADLRRLLAARAGMAEIVAASSLLVDSVAGRDDEPLPDGAVVDVLPPFAGG
jgi:molybdopterin synthase sulfur carrier subunit